MKADDKPVEVRGVDAAFPPEELKKDQGPKTVQLTPYQAFLKAQWEETHPGEPVPIYLNSEGEPVWLNRKQRKTADAIHRRKNKHNHRSPVKSSSEVREEILEKAKSNIEVPVEGTYTEKST